MNTMPSEWASFIPTSAIGIQGAPMTVASIADLERQIEERRSQVLELCQRRDKVQAELDRIDAELQNIVSGASVRRTRLAKNSTSLKTLVAQILGKTRKGLSLDELVSKVQESGYESNSANFKGVVYQSLYNRDDIVRDTKTGLYKLMK